MATDDRDELLIPPTIPADAVNGALDTLMKAHAEDPDGRGDALWEPHPDEFLRALVEDCSGRLRALLERVLDGFLDGAGDGARDGLEHWLWGVDRLLERVANAGVLGDESERLALRADLLGRVRALHGARDAVWDALATGALPGALPARLLDLPARVLPAAAVGMVRIAKARAGLALRDVADGVRARLKREVVREAAAMAAGAPFAGERELHTRLFDRFADTNRDMRRIAVTEIGEAASAGFLDAHPPGARVRRVEAYAGACAWCRGIDGRVFTVVAPADPDKDGERHVWVGKTNEGRSAAPRKRLEDGTLADRGAHERWWVAAGVQHPNCRGRWVRAPDGDAEPGRAPPLPAGVEPEFARWLDGLLEGVRR